MKPRIPHVMVYVTVLLLSWAFPLKAEQFSTFPGFERFYDKYPPDTGLPDKLEQELLEKYRPRFFLAKGHGTFLDFYRDYVAHGQLTDDKGKIVSLEVTQEILNSFRNEPGAVFIHKHVEEKTRQVAYGRVDYDTLPLSDGSDVRLTFLTYNIVFRSSGLPAGLRMWQRMLASIVGSRKDWHQLDHYISATLALSPDNIPLAVTLQQHNYQTTYILGKDISLPDDGRVMVDVAISSNELYPHSPERTEHRCASFLTPESARYIMSGSSRPMLAGVDVTHGQVETEYVLEYLPQTDAFYTFLGMLGEPRWFPHRDGPPGADFNTIPALKPKATSLVAFYRRGDNDDEFIVLLKAWLEGIDSSPRPAIMRRYTERFLNDLAIPLTDSSGE